MVPPVLFLPARAGGFENFPHFWCADAFCREPHCRAEADNLSAVKVFCPKRGSRWRDCRPRASNFAALRPEKQVMRQHSRSRAAKCHKIYNDIIPYCFKLVNSNLFNLFCPYVFFGFYLFKAVSRSNDWKISVFVTFSHSFSNGRFYSKYNLPIL